MLHACVFTYSFTVSVTDLAVSLFLLETFLFGIYTCNVIIILVVVKIIQASHYKKLPQWMYWRYAAGCSIRWNMKCGLVPCHMTGWGMLSCQDPIIMHEINLILVLHESLNKSAPRILSNKNLYQWVWKVAVPGQSLSKHYYKARTTLSTECVSAVCAKITITKHLQHLIAGSELLSLCLTDVQQASLVALTPTEV